MESTSRGDLAPCELRQKATDEDMVKWPGTKIDSQQEQRTLAGNDQNAETPNHPSVHVTINIQNSTLNSLDATSVVQTSTSSATPKPNCSEEKENVRMAGFKSESPTLSAEAIKILFDCNQGQRKKQRQSYRNMSKQHKKDLKRLQKRLDKELERVLDRPLSNENPELLAIIKDVGDEITQITKEVSEKLHKNGLGSKVPETAKVRIYLLKKYCLPKLIEKLRSQEKTIKDLNDPLSGFLITKDMVAEQLAELKFTNPATDRNIIWAWVSLCRALMVRVQNKIGKGNETNEFVRTYKFLINTLDKMGREYAIAVDEKRIQDAITPKMDEIDKSLGIYKNSKERRELLDHIKVLARKIRRKMSPTLTKEMYNVIENIVMTEFCSTGTIRIGGFFRITEKQVDTAQPIFMDGEVPYNNRVPQHLGCIHQRAAIPGYTAAMCGLATNGKVCCSKALAPSFWCTSNSQDKGASTKKRNWIMFTNEMYNLMQDFRRIRTHFFHDKEKRELSKDNLFLNSVGKQLTAVELNFMNEVQNMVNPNVFNYFIRLSLEQTPNTPAD